MAVQDLARAVAIVFLLATFAPLADAASFDCKKATTDIEKMICADPELSKLDEELNAAYKTARLDKKEADVIKQAQKQWMKERDSCADADCVKLAYEARLSSLKGTRTFPDIDVVREQNLTPAISKLNDELDKAVQDVLGKANEEQKHRLLAEQEHWVENTRNVCKNETCLKHAYWSRLAALAAYFEPRSPLYEKESDKAEAIKQVLSTAPLKYSARSSSSRNQFCNQIFDDLKQISGIHFVAPVVQAQSYEDPALDPWKSQCQSAPPFNVSFHCERNIEPADADDDVDACRVGYGLPPFKLYELPPLDASGEKRHIFYADDAYGPMNRDWRKPRFGGGFAGFQQINTTKCLSMVGNYWEDDGKRLSTWMGALADAGQGGRNGKNYNSIIEYKGKYYFLILHEKSYGGYRLDIASVLPHRNKERNACSWFPR